MEKLLLFCLLLISGLSAGAQITLNPDSLSVSGTIDTAQMEAKFEVTNSSGTNISFWWKLIKEDFPKNWTTQVCDVNTCYFEGFDQCPPTNPNMMAAGTTNKNFSVKIKPNGSVGNTLIYYKFYSDSDCTVEIASIPININVGTVSVKGTPSKSSLTIYPNPTVDKFMVNDTESISKLEIYNIAGKLMKTFKVTPGKEYVVGELGNGLYLVRFIDLSGKVHKVVRLSKK